MTAPSFNLLDEPWLPCEQLDGSRVELGIVECLTRAHELKALSDSSPLVTAALHRCLIAVCHRVVDGPATVAAWVEMFQGGRFAAQAVAEYAERWRSRFDLFDPLRPFMQAVDTDEIEPKTPNRLVAERSSYGGPAAVFEHRDDADAPVTISSAEAARALLAFLAFTPGGLLKVDKGRPSAKGAPLNGGAVVLLRGATLFETLALNIIVRERLPENLQGDAIDRPAWEQDNPVTLSTRDPYGWLDLLTWQTRRVRLRPQPDGRAIIGAVVAVGCELSAGASARRDEPMFAWKEHKKSGRKPVNVSSTRGTWRDSNSFYFGTADNAQLAPPSAITQVANPKIARIVGGQKRLHFDVLGMDSFQAKIEAAYVERFPLIPAASYNVDLRATLKTMLSIIEDVASALAGALFTLCKAALAPDEKRKPDQADVKKASDATGALPQYWNEAGRLFAQRWAEAFDHSDVAVAALRKEIGKAAKVILQQAAARLGSTARILKATTLANTTLWRKLGPITNPDSGSQTEVQK